MNIDRSTVVAVGLLLMIVLTRCRCNASRQNCCDCCDCGDGKCSGCCKCCKCCNCDEKCCDEKCCDEKCK